MSEQSAQPPLPAPGWTLLAHGVKENDSITRCPAGHVHVDYGNLTVRFQRDEFLAFARMVEDAVVRIHGVSPNMPHLIIPKSSVTFSLN